MFTIIKYKLAVSGLFWCDLYVYIEKSNGTVEDFVETIYFDPVLWKGTKEKLDHFCFHCYIQQNCILDIHLTKISQQIQLFLHVCILLELFCLYTPSTDNGVVEVYQHTCHRPYFVHRTNK